MDSAYKLAANILKLINQISFIIQLILVVYMFLVTAYWFLNLLDIGLFNFMAGAADAITTSMHNIYDERIVVGKNELDPALLVFDILGMVFLVGLNFLKEFNLQKMKEIDSALEKIRAQREAEFNKKLKAEFEAKMRVFSNYAIIVTFIAKNLFTESIYTGMDTNAGVKEHEELAFKTLYAAVKDIPNCKFAKNGTQLILTSNHFDSIDKVLTTIDLATARIRQNFKKEKWLLTNYMAVETFDNKTTIKEVYPNLIKLIKLKVPNEILCMGNFNLRYGLLTHKLFNVYLNGLYDLGDGQDTNIYSLVKIV